MASRSTSIETAEALLAEKLRGVDIRKRLSALGIAYDDRSGLPAFEAFGKTISVAAVDNTLFRPGSEAPIHPVERIIILRYLTHPLPVKPSGELIGFRDLPGGMFYYGPFTARAVAPLVRTAGDDLESLRAGLSRFRWEAYPGADFGAAITVVGPVALYLLYWRGDGEFGARAEYLFDRAVRRIFSADEIAALASHVTGEIRRAVNS